MQISIIVFLFIIILLLTLCKISQPTKQPKHTSFSGRFSHSTTTIQASLNDNMKAHKGQIYVMIQALKMEEFLIYLSLCSLQEVTINVI